MNITLLLETVAAMHPERVAVRADGRDVRYADMVVRCRRWGTWLRERARGAPVLYLGQHGRSFGELLFGSGYAGSPLVPVNYRVKPDEVRYFVRSVSPGFAMVEHGYRSLLDAGLGEGNVLGIGAPEAEPPQGTVEAPFESDAAAVALFTSGTTSRPKPTWLSHGNLTSYVLNTVQAGSAAAHEATLVAVPPYHIAGVAGVLSNVYRGRRLVIMPQFAPRRWLELVRREGVTHAMVVPTMLSRILDELEQSPDLMPMTLTSLAYGGSKASASLVNRALRMLPSSVGLVNAFGLTETSSTVTMLGPEDHRTAFDSDDPAARARLASAGRPVPGVEIRVVSEDGEPLGPGEEGELWVRGAQVAAAGENDSASVDDQGWLHTKDLGYFDDAGYLFVLARTDDLIIRGGENITPQEIRRILEAHPAVRDAAIVGIPDEEWGHVIGALVVGDRSASEAELQAWVRARLAGFKVPEVIAWCEELPYNDMGKVVRSRAVELLQRR